MVFDNSSICTWEDILSYWRPIVQHHCRQCQKEILHHFIYFLELIKVNYQYKRFTSLSSIIKVYTFLSCTIATINTAILNIVNPFHLFKLHTIASNTNELDFLQDFYNHSVINNKFTFQQFCENLIYFSPLCKETLHGLH